MEKINIAIIGNGKSCHRYHLPYIEESKLFEVKVIYSRTSNIFGMPYPKEYNHTHDINDIMHEDIKVVVITTPAETHYKLAKMCIEHNKHVIIEKPLCHRVEELKELYALSKKHNVKIMPFQNRRYDNDFLTIKQIINDSNNGEIIEIESNHTYFRETDVVTSNNIYEGFIYGHAVHYLDQIISIFGKPDKIIKDTENQRLYYVNKNSMHASEDMYDIKLIYNKMHVRVKFSPMSHFELPSWVVNTTKYGFVKQKRDAQESFLKKGIYPFDVHFGIDDDYVFVYQNNEIIKTIKPVFKTHALFYQNVYEVIVNNAEPTVKESEAVLLLSLMQEMVENDD